MQMTAAKEVAPEGLDELIRSLLLGNLMSQGGRRLGVEYERLVLHREDRSAAPLDFCREFFSGMVDRLSARPMVDGDVVKGLVTDRFEMSMEPGGQLEVSTPPHENLDAVDAGMADATAVIEDALAGSPYELVCLGHTPVTPVEQLGLLPRERYRIMDEVMPPRGALTRNMMRATAGFQLTYDVETEADAARKLAILYRLSPLLMSITANSRQVAGEDSGYASYRHLVWLQTDTARTGVPPGCLRAETAIEGYIRFATRAVVMFLERDGKLQKAPQKSLAELVAEGGITTKDVDDHLSGLFPFVRLRNYIEIRTFDSVDWDLARSVLALASGIVYCEHATGRAETLSESIAPDDPEQLAALHVEAARNGLDARCCDGASFRELAQELITYSGATLGGEGCSWARPRDLDRVRAEVEGSS